MVSGFASMEQLYPFWDGYAIIPLILCYGSMILMCYEEVDSVASEAPRVLVLKPLKNLMSLYKSSENNEGALNSFLRPV